MRGIIFLFFIFFLDQVVSSRILITGQFFQGKIASNIFEMNGNIIAKTKLYSLKSHRLIYNQKTKAIRAQDDIILNVKKDGLEVKGDRFFKQGEFFKVEHKTKKPVRVYDKKANRKVETDVLEFSKSSKKNHKEKIVFKGETHIWDKSLDIKNKKQIQYFKNQDFYFFDELTNIYKKDKNYLIVSKDIEYYEKDGKMIFKQPFSILDTYKKSTLKADKGVYHFDEEEAIFEDNVSYANEEMEVQCDRLNTIDGLDNKKAFHFYNQDDSKIDFIAKDYKGQGQDMYYYKDTSNILISGGVKFNQQKKALSVESEEFLTVEGSNEFKFYQDVKVKQKNEQITGLYGTYNKETEVLEVIGNTKLISENKIYRAQKIILDTKLNSIQMRGEVRAQMKA